MLGYIVRRLLWSPVVLFTVTFFVFFLGNYGPGDPVEVLMGVHNDPEVVARIKKERGLDKPFYIQYANYIWRALHGDLGESFKFRGQSVAKLVFQKIGVSAQLGLVAMVIGVSVGVTLGMVAALNQGKIIDPIIVSIALFISSVPVFILWPFLIILFVKVPNELGLPSLPSSGWGGIFDAKIIMPAIVLSLGPIGGLTRIMRASTTEVINQDYVRTARAKGLSPMAIRIHHVGRNALLPVFTVVGLSMATLVSGAFITETLFGIPGIGRLAVESIFARDYPVITALILITAVAYIFANLLVDIGYTFLDPRIRYT
ncbi:MAG: Oligopeptide transport system permease protein OppB [Dehalococcoidia bacterium]|nr:Oligopeptide transport system permease protein OppB [Dehalococcoidia bacterium]